MLADPITLSLLGAGTLLGMGGSIAEGETADKAAKFKAKTQRAKGSRKAYEAGREGEILESNARAAMAAGGGSTTDAGATKILGDIGAQAEYNALSALYEGETGADISEWEGKTKKKASKTRALSTLLSGGAGMYKAYKDQ